MRYYDTEISIPEGYSILPRPIDWSKPGDCFSYEMPDPESLCNVYGEVTDTEMHRLIESFEINNWLFVQGSKLRNVKEFKIGLYENKVFNRTRSNIKSQFYTVLFEKRSIYLFYKIPPKEEL